MDTNKYIFEIGEHVLYVKDEKVAEAFNAFFTTAKLIGYKITTEIWDWKILNCGSIVLKLYESAEMHQPVKFSLEFKRDKNFNLINI